MAAEEVARADKDGSLQTRLAADEAALAAEIGATNADVTSIDVALAAEIAATNADVGSIDTRVAAEEGARAGADTALGGRIDAVEAMHRQFAQAISAGGTMTKDLATGVDSAKSVLNNSIQIFLNGLRLHFDAAATSDGTCTSGDYWYDASAKEIHVQDVVAGDMVEVQWNMI